MRFSVFTMAQQHTLLQTVLLWPMFPLGVSVLYSICVQSVHFKYINHIHMIDRFDSCVQNIAIIAAK